jgi:hypothetical protein
LAEVVFAEIVFARVVFAGVILARVAPGKVILEGLFLSDTSYKLSGLSRSLLSAWGKVFVFFIGRVKDLYNLFLFSTRRQAARVNVSIAIILVDIIIIYPVGMSMRFFGFNN